MSSPENNAIGGIWPLGRIIITSGTPQQVTSKVGPQDATEFVGISPQSSTGRPFSAKVHQLTFSAASTNLGDVIVNDGNVAGADANRTVLWIAPGETVSLPFGALTEESEIDPSRYWVDGTEVRAEDAVCIFAADSSS